MYSCKEPGRQIAAAMLQRPCGAPGLHQELKKRKGKSPLCAEQVDMFVSRS